MRQHNMRIQLRAVPLCNEIVECLQKNYEFIDALREGFV